MKLVYLSSSVLPSRNANSVHVMKMCQAFAKAGAEVILYAPRNTSVSVEEIFNYFGIEKYSFKLALRPFVYFCNLRVISYVANAVFGVKKDRPDIIYGRDLRSIFFSALINPRAKVFYESHKPFSSYRQIDKLFIKWMIARKNFIKFVVISKALHQIYLQELGLAASDFIVLHDGADAPASLEIKCHLTKRDSLKAGYAGHLYKGRGIELIIKLAERLPNVQFLIAGGKEEDIAMWSKSINLDNLIFKGYLPPAEVASFLTDCDILLAPYQHAVSIDGEGDTSAYMSPLKIFEYMAAGRPMIVSDLPVLHEVLSEDDVCFADPSCVDSWIQRIEYLRDSDNRLRMAKNALEKLVANYTWKVRAEKVLGNV